MFILNVHLTVLLAHAILIWTLMTSQGVAFKFSVIQHLHHNLKNPKELLFDKTIHDFNDDEIQVLRSYKPHLMHSYSYPTPITAHWFYGEVIRERPLFYVRDLMSTNQISKQILSVNNYYGKGLYELHDFLQFSPISVFKYMLSLQIQSSIQNSWTYPYIGMKSNDKFYAILCQYNDKKKQYLLYFTYEGERVVTLKRTKELGLRYRFRDESGLSQSDAWKVPLKLMWSGSSREGIQPERFGGLVMELEYEDPSLITSLKVHIKQIYDKPLGLQSPQQALKRLLAIPVDMTFWEEQSSPVTLKSLTCAQDATYKLFSGLSYEYGTLQVVNYSHPIPNEPQGLLSFSPSRTRFPWGFLWDDGFHCEVAARSEPKLALKVIKSWLSTMMKNGWIPREQNRGAERVFLCNCPKFMKKDIRDGNPPTLMLAVDYLANKKYLNKENFSIQYWSKLEKWYSWFINTQKSQSQQFLFSWHDSIPNNGSFNSGMDDFPRMLSSLGHVDLQAWLYFFSEVMEKIYPIYTSELGNTYSLFKRQIRSMLLDRFVDPKDGVCKDFSASGHFSEFVGYPSLLPLAFGMLDYHSFTYNGTIKLIKERMDTGSGISSITKDSKFYLSNKGRFIVINLDAYWKGPVWININYLVLRGLYKFYPKQKALYEKLRRELLNTVCGNWRKTGLFYENYIQGRGSFSAPFNGWTSLIAIIDSQEY